MAVAEQSVEVDVPVTTAYNQWTQFEDFPRFMEGVEEVRQLDDAHLAWKASIGGRTKEWRARITDQEPDTRVAWTSEEGAENSGIVTFEPVGEDHARINVHIEAEPEGAVEQAGEAVGALERRVSGDLQRFKEFIESRGSETGAWRGSIG